MYQIMKITIYLLIAFMLMGTEKCDSPYLKKPYVPDPICKSNLENTREWVDQAYRRLSTLDVAKKARTSLKSELKNLEAGLDAMKKASNFAIANCNVIKCVIKDGRKRTLTELLNDLRNQMPLVESYLVDVRRQNEAARNANHDNMVELDVRRRDGGEVGDLCSGGVIRLYTQYEADCWGYGRFLKARKDADSSWAKMKNVTFTTKLKGHEGPLRELAKDGCVARS